MRPSDEEKMLRELERLRVGRMGRDDPGPDMLEVYAGRPSAGAKALGIGPRCEWGNPYPIGHEGVDLSIINHAAHQLHGFARDCETEISVARSETGDAQDTYRVFDKGVGHMA